MMFVGCWEILSTAWGRLRHPQPIEIGVVPVVVLAVTVLTNFWAVRIERREGRRLGSELLMSDAAHSLSDVYATLLVIVSFIAQRLGWAWADLAACAIIVVLIVRAGATILRGTLSTLSDERRIAPRDIEDAAAREPGVLEVHNVRSRGPLDDIHVDLHVLVHPTTPLAEAHAIGHRVEQRLQRGFPGVTDVVVHVEPGLEQERATHREGGGLKASG